jgi:hypothetical protein
MKNVKNYNGFDEGDIVNVKDGWLTNMELEIIKLEDDGYAGNVVFKVVTSDLGLKGTNYLKFKKDKIINDYGVAILPYATMVKKGNGKASSVYIRKSKINKFILEVDDLSVSKKDWQKEMYDQDGVNIGITVFNKKNGYMSDQDIPDILPELEELELGDVYLDENGFLGLVSDYSAQEIKNILITNGFTIR